MASERQAEIHTQEELHCLPGEEDEKETKKEETARATVQVTPSIFLTVH